MEIEVSNNPDGSKFPRMVKKTSDGSQTPSVIVYWYKSAALKDSPHKLGRKGIWVVSHNKQDAVQHYGEIEMSPSMRITLRGDLYKPRH